MSTLHAPADCHLPFSYIGGDASIDFVNTVDWADSAQPLNRLTSYARILEWTEGTDLLDASAVARLRTVAEARPGDAATTLKEAIRLRGTLEQLYFALTRGERASNGVQELNDMWLNRALAGLKLVHCGKAAFELGWVQMENALGAPLEVPLWAVTWAAAKLLTSDDVGRIKRCGGPNCGWYYVDRSRNGLRRWCEMETCGTRMKSRRRAERNERLRSSPGT